MPLVNRDPFARSELHKERVYDVIVGCDYCGNVCKTPRNGRKFLFRFFTESDGGSRRSIKGLFCSNQCRVFYHGES